MHPLCRTLGVGGSKKIDPMVLAKDEDSRLNVCVRLRPINKIEADLQNEAVWSADVDDRCAHGFPIHWPDLRLLASIRPPLRAQMHRGRIGTKFWPRVSVRLAPASRLSERGLLHSAAAGSHSIIATARAQIISKYTPILVSVSSRPLWQGKPPTHSPTHPLTHTKTDAPAHIALRQRNTPRHSVRRGC